MLTFERFRGINNVAPEHRLSTNELRVATNVDVGLSGELRRRRGYTCEKSGCFLNLWEGADFWLATDINGALISFSAPGEATTVVHPAMSTERIHYVNFPDGRTGFSNGLICGITDGVTYTSWGVDAPPSAGVAMEVAGNLEPGTYMYRLAYRRLSDGREGGTTRSAPFQLTEGGVLLTGLPLLAGHEIVVYLTTANGEEFYLAGRTALSSFTFTGAGRLLQIRRAADFDPAPAGKWLGFWRGRALVAVDNVLHFSRPHSWEHFDVRRDFVQLSAPITAVVPAEQGIFVGTEHELVLLAGDSFADLTLRPLAAGRVTPGSGVALRGEFVTTDKDSEGRVGSGDAAIFIVDGALLAAFDSGAVSLLTQERYVTAAKEVVATFRLRDGVPQYVAVPQ